MPSGQLKGMTQLGPYILRDPVPYDRLLPMNLLFVNASHHLLGLPSMYTFSISLMTSSCLA